jgi:hypothetical protein
MEPKAQERSFTVNDLLVGTDVFPGTWEELESFYPNGDDLCSSECAGVVLGITEAATELRLASQLVYRYDSPGISQREFDYVYLAKARGLEPNSAWTFVSSTAEQSDFGCQLMAGHVLTACCWAARYEEIIVVFTTQIEIADMDLIALEKVVRAIDDTMSSHLQILPALP